jgi:hypothetical protein
MAWTSPKTWSFGEVLTSTDMNTYVRDNSQALFDGAGSNLVAVKSALFTGTQTNSTASGANFAVTDLTITHAVADSANRLIISAFVGALNSSASTHRMGIAVFDGTNFLAVGAAAGNRTSISAGGRMGSVGTEVGYPAITFVHTPGAGSKTYTVRAFNLDTTTETIHVNRIASDTDAVDSPRAVSSLIIQEVRV